MHANSRTARRLLSEAWLENGVYGPTSHKGHYVWDYLYEHQGGCCAICGIEDEWNGVTLALIVDHINGDTTNDRRENLRLICPNCDSQPPTFRQGIAVAVATTGDSGTPRASPAAA